jgi:glycosyltransferase involved in cell wall biosynthesis
MNIIAVKTYNRLHFLQPMFESLMATKTGKCRIIVADDGSTDGTIEWLKEQKGIELILNRRKGVAGQVNSILKYIEKDKYTNLFLCDDDILFEKKGWLKIYTDGLKQVGHLSHYYLSWRPQDNLKKPIKKGKLICNCKPLSEQGAFLAFTKATIDGIGFVDVEKIGLSAMYHTDFSRRAYKFKGLNPDVVFDVQNSNQYIKLNMTDYCSAAEVARYNVWDTPQAQVKKLHVCRTNDIYIPFAELDVNFNGTSKSVLNKQFYKIYCINLERRPDRRAYMQAEADRMNMDITFINAIDGKDWKPKGMLNGGQLACIESHKEVWKQAIKDNVQRFLVLEDDVLFHKDLQNFDFETLPEWNMLYLGACQFSWGVEIKGNVYKCNHDTLATHAIAYTIEAAKKILIEAEKTSSNLPLDNWVASVAPKKLKCYCIFPNLIIQKKMDDSDIKAATTDYVKGLRWNYDDYYNGELPQKKTTIGMIKVEFLRFYQKHKPKDIIEMDAVKAHSFILRKVVKRI